MSAAAEDRYVELNGTRFRYRLAGEGNERTVFLLHGGRGIGDLHGEWSAYRALADRYRVIGYDQRGCGLSSITHPMTFRQYADDLDALRRHFCGEDGRIILQGGSFGGMIALTYAVHYQRHLTHLIVRGTAPSHHHEAEARERFKARIDRVPLASPAMIDKLFSDRVADDTELRLIWFALQPLYFESFDADAVLERVRTMRFHAETHNALFRDKSYDLRGRLAGIGVPTLVIVGAEDWICPPGQSRLIAERVPGAELFEVAGANHSVQAEANERVLARVRAFLGGADRQ